MALSTHLFDNVRGVVPNGFVKLDSTPKTSAPAVVFPPPVPPAPRIHGHFVIDDEIVGLAGVDEEDKDFVKQLLVYVVTVKCTDKAYDSMSYERPAWVRIEVGVGEYLILFGGWKSIGITHLKLISNFDCQAGNARNVIDVEVTMAAPNTNPSGSELTLVVRYKTESQKRRQAALQSTGDDVHHASESVSADNGGAGKRHKRGLLGTVFDFVINGV